MCAKEWEGISGLVSEPCNSKAFGKLLKTFKKISNSLRSDSEIFSNNADFQALRVATLPTRFTPKENPAYAGSWKIVVTVHSVHSNVAQIHSRLPAAMEFWLVCLGIVVCEQ